MRVLLDTNVLLAAFISPGQCMALLEHCAINHVLISSPFILDEFRHKLLKKFRFSEADANESERLLREVIQIVTPNPLAQPVCRDRDDDSILACAVDGRGDCILTGDADLLVLAAFRGIPILKPAQFAAFEAESQA